MTKQNKPLLSPCDFVNDSAKRWKLGRNDRGSAPQGTEFHNPRRSFFSVVEERDEEGVADAAVAGSSRCSISQVLVLVALQTKTDWLLSNVRRQFSQDKDGVSFPAPL